MWKSYSLTLDFLRFIVCLRIITFSTPFHVINLNKNMCRMISIFYSRIENFLNTLDCIAFVSIESDSYAHSKCITNNPNVAVIPWIWLYFKAILSLRLFFCCSLCWFYLWSVTWVNRVNMNKQEHKISKDIETVALCFIVIILQTCTHTIHCMVLGPTGCPAKVPSPL